jgi:hypothetical protein
MSTIPLHLRGKRIWTVDDFAEFLGGGCSQYQARERLKTYDTAMSGMLLIVSKGANRKYTFYPAHLARAFPGVFEPFEGLGVQVAEHGDKIEELYQRDRQITARLGEVTRENAKLKREVAELKRTTKRAA